LLVIQQLGIIIVSIDSPPTTSIMADKRVSQIAGHLNYPRGLLAGQVAIITGSGQGIGAEAARLFANEGAKVVVSDIDASKTSNGFCTTLDLEHGLTPK
jgi:S-adenosylhomocysteine hydrolase